MAERISRDNQYWKFLIRLVHAIDGEICLSRESVILILHLMDSEDKILSFNDWVKTRIQNGKFQATEDEVTRTVSMISKHPNSEATDE